MDEIRPEEESTQPLMSANPSVGATPTSRPGLDGIVSQAAGLTENDHA